MVVLSQLTLGSLTWRNLMFSMLEKNYLKGALHWKRARLIRQKIVGHSIKLISITWSIIVIVDWTFTFVMKIVVLMRNWFLSVFPLLSFWKAATENGSCNVSITEIDAFSKTKFRWMIAQMNEYWECRMDRGDFVVNFFFSFQWFLIFPLPPPF